MKLKFSAVMFFGLSVGLFQDAPAQGQRETGSTFQVVPTPNENLNSELFCGTLTQYAERNPGRKDGYRIEVGFSGMSAA